jgi:phosphoglycerate kinase
MSFNKKTVRDVELSGKRVLVRADYNVPIKHGKITSDYRITQSVPTIKYLLKQGAKVIICSHLGRPEGRPDPEYSLKPIAARLSELLGHAVMLAPDCIGSEVAALVEGMEPRQILLLENLRFHPEEEENDSSFAKKLAGLADVFVQDGFGVVHRAHASTEGITNYLPAVSGLLLEKEVDTITSALEKPERPLMAIVGGAKISDKITVLKKFIEIADFVAIGGAMANTFLLAKGIETGKSLTEPEDVPLAREIMKLAQEKAARGKFVFYLPQDGVVATDIESPKSTRIVDWDAHVIADIESYPKRPTRSASQIKSDERILDVGPFSASFIAGGIQMVQTVVWNGTLGVAEIAGLSNDPVGPFAHGTDLVMDALLGHFGHRPFTIVGGGDTAGYVEDRGLTKAFNHVSTGGGASLELMEGRKLPGIEALQNKPS